MTEPTPAPDSRAVLYSKNCSKCGGIGLRGEGNPDTDADACPKCGGTGETTDMTGPDSRAMPHECGQQETCNCTNPPRREPWKQEALRLRAENARLRYDLAQAFDRAKNS